jgi:thiosulfate/3-mercaptopyruvate sulfurtransferase
LITVDELAARLNDPSLVILDATVLLPPPRFDGDYRVESGFARFREAHIPNARFADLTGELSDHHAAFHFAMPAPRVFADSLESLGVSSPPAQTAPVVVYDTEGGFWAARLWWMMRSIGLEASVLDGGLREWRKSGHAVESGPARTAARGRVLVRENPQAWIDRRAVEVVVAGERPGTLICALSSDVFSGKAATRYARPGHIPGSLNLSARSVFDSEGRYLDPTVLADVVKSVLPTANRPLILYCGGGISAAADALALTLLGESDVSIYDGSLEEWAAVPELPLVLGN